MSPADFSVEGLVVFACHPASTDCCRVCNQPVHAHAFVDVAQGHQYEIYRCPAPVPIS